MADGRSGHAEVDLHLPARPSSVTEARRAVARLAREVGASEEHVALGVSEAVGNSVLHAFRDTEPGMIRVLATPGPGILTVVVADDGSGLAPNPDTRGLGFGIPLISQVARNVRFDSSEEGTSVSMSFDAGGSGFASEHSPERAS
jgi:anti-sigma regulatory factor (Ser/Thr protein kinase)